MTPDLDDRVDALLEPWHAALGPDLTGYRNHCRRVAAFALALAPPGPEVAEKLAVAAAFHDLGIWTDRTFDYLAPSRRLARAHLEATGRGDWAEELAAMIDLHHKCTPFTARPDWLVEPFRRADWADVTLGLRRRGLPAALVREVRARHPNAGFHRRLLALSWERLRRHPASPLPMLRW